MAPTVPAPRPGPSPGVGVDLRARTCVSPPGRRGRGGASLKDHPLLPSGARLTWPWRLREGTWGAVKAKASRPHAPVTPTMWASAPLALLHACRMGWAERDLGSRLSGLVLPSPPTSTDPSRPLGSRSSGTGTLSPGGGGGGGNTHRMSEGRGRAGEKRPAPLPKQQRLRVSAQRSPTPGSIPRIIVSQAGAVSLPRWPMASGVAPASELSGPARPPEEATCRPGPLARD